MPLGRIYYDVSISLSLLRGESFGGAILCMRLALIGTCTFAARRQPRFPVDAVSHAVCSITHSKGALNSPQKGFGTLTEIMGVHIIYAACGKKPNFPCRGHPRCIYEFYCPSPPPAAYSPMRRFQCSQCQSPPPPPPASKFRWPRSHFPMCTKK